MATPEIDPITWKEIVGGAMLACTGLLTYIVHKNDKRLDDMENSAVTSLEAHRQEDRENFRALFEGQSDIKDTLSDGFADMNKTLHGIHTSMLEKINDKQDKSGRRSG